MREFDSLLQAPSLTVLTTYRKDGTAVGSPVWFRFQDNTFEVVITQDDVKLRHLAARPECELVVFEAVPPFRGVRARISRCWTAPVRSRRGQRSPCVTSAKSAGRGSPPSAPAPASCCGCHGRAPTWDLTPILPS